MPKDVGLHVRVPQAVAKDLADIVAETKLTTSKVMRIALHMLIVKHKARIKQ